MTAVSSTAPNDQAHNSLRSANGTGYENHNNKVTHAHSLAPSARTMREIWSPEPCLLARRFSGPFLGGLPVQPAIFGASPSPVNLMLI